MPADASHCRARTGPTGPGPPAAAPPTGRPGCFPVAFVMVGTSALVRTSPGASCPASVVPGDSEGRLGCATVRRLRSQREQRGELVTPTEARTGPCQLSASRPGLACQHCAALDLAPPLNGPGPGRDSPGGNIARKLEGPGQCVLASPLRFMPFPGSGDPPVQQAGRSSA
jgi:hypothetical protein